MELQLVDTADGSIRVKATGPITPDAPEHPRDPLIGLLGPQVFERRVALDLEEADFISSSGIGWLLYCHKRFEQHGGKLELGKVSKPIDQVLRLMRLQTVLHWA
jgi:anti-anti-sigma factor